MSIMNAPWFMLIAAFVGCRNFVVIPWACAVLRHRPGHAWLSKLMEESEDRLACMEPQDLAGLAWSLAALSCTPSLRWLARLEEALSQR